jgi:hypothetical protein
MAKSDLKAVQGRRQKKRKALASQDEYANEVEKPRKKNARKGKKMSSNEIALDEDVLPTSLDIERRSHIKDLETLHNGDGGAEKKGRKEIQKEANRERKLNRKEMKLKTRKKRKDMISPSSSQQSEATDVSSHVADTVSAYEHDCSSLDDGDLTSSSNLVPFTYLSPRLGTSQKSTSRFSSPSRPASNSKNQGLVADIESASDLNSLPTPGPYPHSSDRTRNWSSCSHHSSPFLSEPQSPIEAVAATIEECHDLLYSTLEDCSASIHSQIPLNSDALALEAIENVTRLSVSNMKICTSSVLSVTSVSTKIATSSYPQYSADPPSFS